MFRVYRILFIFFLSGFLSRAYACPEGVDKLAKIVESEMDTSVARASGAGHAAGGANLGQDTALLAQDSKAAQIGLNSDEATDVIQASAHEANSVTNANSLGHETTLLSQDGKAAQLTMTSDQARDAAQASAYEAQAVAETLEKFKMDRLGDYEIGTNGTLLHNADKFTANQKVRAIILNADERAKIRNLRTPRRFKALYKESQLEFDNRLFIKGIDNVPPGKKAVYFDVENSMLKQLNDEILETKDYSDAATNFFNKTMWDKIQADPVLRTKLEGRYRDFKSMRFRFLLDEGEDATDLMNRLKKAYGDASSKFGDFMGKTGLEPLWNGKPGQAGKPEKWFLAGVGDTPLEANMAARQARGMVEDMGTSNRLVQYSDRVDNLAGDISNIEKVRDSLSNVQSLKKSGIMVDPGNGRHVLDKDAIGILRKTKRADFEDIGEYRAAVKKQFKTLYGSEVDNLSVDAMTRYFEGVDSLAPPLFVRSRTGIDLSEAKNGLVSVDFTGVGVDNAYEAMVGLTKNVNEVQSNASLVGSALTSVDKHVDNVTDAMNKSKQAFNNGTQSVTKAEKPAVFSGDDGMYFPDKKWTNIEKQKLVDELAQNDPSKYRVTFVETTYKNGETIPPAMRSEYIVKAEKVEKSIRKLVTGVGEGRIPPERAKEMMIAIEYKPAINGKSDWDIVFGGKLDHTEQTVLRRALESVIEANH